MISVHVGREVLVESSEPGGSLDLYLGDWSQDQLAGLVEWMLFGDGDSYGGSTFPMPIYGVRQHGAEYFAKAKNAWNQRVNRQKKASQAKNTIIVDPRNQKEDSEVSC